MKRLQTLRALTLQIIFSLKLSWLYPIALIGTNLRLKTNTQAHAIVGCFAFFINQRGLRALELEDLLVFVENRQTSLKSFFKSLTDTRLDELRQQTIAFQRLLRPNPHSTHYDALQRLYDLRYGVRFNASTYDLFDEFGDMLCRCSTKKTEHIDNFLTYRAIPNDVSATRLAQVLDDAQDDLAKFGFDKDAFERLTGHRYPDVEGVPPGPPHFGSNGYAPDYNKFDDDFIGEYVYPGRGLGHRDNAQIKIKMSGDYAEDFRRAKAAAGIDDSIDLSREWVWHHLDDYNPVDNTCTMQLVRKEIHNKVIIKPALDDIALNKGLEHAGACAIWKRFHNLVGYDY